MDAAVLRSFLDHIKADPLDDTHRLVLADWLQEHGDTEADHARGEYLRLFVHARARPFWSDPGRAETERLLATYSPAWTEPVRVHKRLLVSSEGGLLTILGNPTGLLSRAVRAVAATPAWDWVDTIMLNGTNRKLPDVLNRPLFAGVRRLRLDIHRDQQAEVFDSLLASPYLESLRSVHFEYVALGKQHLERLANWSVLPRLNDLQAVLSGAAGPAFAKLPLAGLRSLSLSVAEADLGTLTGVFRSPHLAGVRSLHVFCGKSAMEAFAEVADGTVFRDLAALDLSYSEIENEGAATLATVEFPALRRLRLSGCKIQPKGARALARAPWLSRLERLDLHGNSLAKGAAELLAAPLTSLRWLDLSNAWVTPEGLAALTASPHVQRLEILSLDGNFLGDRVGELFAASEALPALRVLDLNDAGLAGKNLQGLAGWPGLARLEALNLSPVSVRAGGFSALLASPHYNHRTRIAFAGEPWAGSGG
jgi:uncharacterized protein (TIGR02996 family)